MSILQIGQNSRQYQGSPGCRKYVSPFLTHEEKESIQRQKERNQHFYHQILKEQMKTNLKQKQAQKKKQIQQDLKHQRLFYQKIKVLRQVDSKMEGRKNINAGSFTRSFESDASTFEESSFKKSKQLTLPQLKSPTVGINRRQSVRPSIFTSKYPQQQRNYLKYNSLMEIGSRLRQQSTERNIFLENEIQSDRNYDLSHLEKAKFDKTFYRPQKRYNQLKNQMKEKEIEIYELLEKSSLIIQSTKSPLRQIKKRLKTQPIHMPEDYSDEEVQPVIIRSRLRTQFYPHIMDDEDEFYKLPSKNSISSIDYTTINMSPESNTVPSYRTDVMMRIEEENPQIQSNEHVEQKYQDES